MLPFNNDYIYYLPVFSFSVTSRKKQHFTIAIHNINFITGNNIHIFYLYYKRFCLEKQDIQLI